MKKKRKRINNAANAECSKKREFPNLNVGDHVKMSDELKLLLNAGGCADHVIEFGDCVGIVDCQIKYPNSISPELDVRWQPSNLQYGYDPRFLIKKENQQ